MRSRASRSRGSARCGTEPRAASARPRGDRPRLGHAREVVQQLRPGRRGSFVAERDEHRRGALGRGDDARSHLDPARTPARERSHDVLERRDESARGGDDELDAPVVVMLDVRVDRVDERCGPWPGELAVEGHDESVGTMLDCEGHLRTSPVGACVRWRGGAVRGPDRAKRIRRRCFLHGPLTSPRPDRRWAGRLPPSSASRAPSPRGPPPPARRRARAPSPGRAPRTGR